MVASYDVIPPAGVSPAAAFSPETDASVPAVPVGMLADPIDPETGELTSVAAYVHPIDAAIAEQFRLWRGTGVAVVDQGQNFRQVELATESAPRELEDEAKRILGPFVQRGEIRIVKLVTEAPIEGGRGDNALITVHYRNLLTGRERRVGR